MSSSVSYMSYSTLKAKSVLMWLCPISYNIMMTLSFLTISCS